MTGSPAPIRVSRRRLLVASSATLAAGAPLVLAACGAAEDDEATSPEGEAELLNEVLAGQLAVLEAAMAHLDASPETAARTMGELSVQRGASTRVLARAITELGGTPVGGPAESVAAESPVEAAARQIEGSIATSLDAIGELTTDDYRQTVHRAVTEDAAALAVLRDTLGEEPSPDAFVMGAPSEKASAE